MTVSINRNSANTNQQIQTLQIAVISLVNQGPTIGLVLISITNLLKSLVFSFPYTYICSNSTHSASHKNSKWVFFFLGHTITYNTPPLPLLDAHFGGLFFFSKSFSLTQNTLR